jgi:uncharacterized protein YecT (DUF1311 family)
MVTCLVLGAVGVGVGVVAALGSVSAAPESGQHPLCRGTAEYGTLWSVCLPAQASKTPKLPLIPIPAPSEGLPPCNLDGSQLALDVCADNQVRTTDRVVNSEIRRIFGAFGSGGYERSPAGVVATFSFIAAENSWLASRNYECASEAAGNLGGSIHPLVELTCEAQLNRERLADLQRFLTALTSP